LTNKCAVFPFIVTPAKAGIQPPAVDWTRAFVGVTIEKWSSYFSPEP
jgi:hypothetical protein